MRPLLLVTLLLTLGAMWPASGSGQPTAPQADSIAHATADALPPLRAFEAAIDSTAGSARWRRPARRP